MDNEKMPKNAEKYFCEKCNFICSKKSNFDIHLLTAKHRRITKDNEKMPKNAELFFCENCGNEYKYASGLSKHRKKCIIIPHNDDNDINKNDTVELVKYIMKENKEMMMELCKTMQPAKTVNTVNNTTNYFNIQMFLNEQCKDAMNMTEFIESIHLTLEDMTQIGIKGQTKGMTNILIDKLNELDVVKRPVHCSDMKNETIYVKDEDKWEQETDDKPKLKNALDQLTKKSIKAMPCMEDDPDSYVKTISEVMKDPREDKKIISQLAKKVLV